MKKLGIFCLILALLTFTSCNNSKPTVTKNSNNIANENKTISNDKWIADLDYLQEGITKLHINPFYRISKSYFNKEVERLKKDVPNLDDNEIKIRIYEIVASLEDAHSSPCYGKSNEFYPLTLCWFGDDLRVIETSNEFSNILGKKLISINDIPVNNIINKINTIIPNESSQFVKDMNRILLTYPEILKSFKIIDNDYAIFVFEDDDNHKLDIKLSPCKQDIKNLKYEIKNRPYKPTVIDDKPNPFWYEYIPSDKILYFNYNSCVDNTASSKYFKDPSSYPSFDEFLNELIKTLNECQIEKFIIDLRGNCGGYSQLLDHFISKLQYNEKWLKQINKKGNLFVLTDKGCFSAAFIACTQLKKNTNAIFLGEPTGGTYNSFGGYKWMTLPNSNINITYSTTMNDNSGKGNSSFIPNVIIEQSFENYKNGIDDVYEAVKNYKRGE